LARVTKIFVSYSRHDQETDRVEALVAWLHELSNQTIEFTLDTQLRYGESVRDFEKSVQVFDNVLIIGTRRYKEKVISGEYGVSREHNYILEQMKQRKMNVFLAVMEDSHPQVFRILCKPRYPSTWRE